MAPSSHRPLPAYVDRELLWAMFEESPVRTAVLTNRGRLAYVNRALCATFGYAPEELVGRAFDELGHPDAQEEQRAAALFRSLRSGAAEQGEMDRRCVHKGGGILWLHVLARALKDKRGEPAHFLLVVRDASGRKRAEQSLRQNEERFRQIAHYSKDVFWVLDLEPGGSVYVNPAFEGVWGFWPEGGVLTFSEWGKTIHPDDRERVVREFEQARRSDIECNVEYRVVRPDGTIRYIHDRGAVIRDVRGKPYRVAGVASDVTHRVTMERLKNDFISMISHEIRTPLTSLHASLGLIAGGVVGEIPGDMRALLEIAQEGSTRLVRLVSDLLDIEKIESGRMEYRMSPVDLVQLVGHVVDATRAQGIERGIELLLTCEVESAPVIADPDRLVQVLTNLLSNAAKFSADGAPVEVSVKRSGSFFRVSVLDYGAGIPPSARDRVFEKFGQADSSSTRAHGGTGLGLSIARSIVERHGGAIHFESEPGRGTVFFFDIPVRDADTPGDRESGAG